MKLLMRLKVAFVGILFIFALYFYNVNVPNIFRGQYLNLENASKCRMIPSTYYLSITSITKNSKHYIVEWIEYHRLVGVEHFFLLDNDSDDGLNETLKYYVDRNIVTLIPWSNTYYRDVDLKVLSNTQQTGIIHALEKYGCQTHWSALIDDDEFIVHKNPNKSLHEVLSEYEPYGGLALGWLWFGSNGHVEKPDKLVIESYTACSEKLDILYKSIVRPALMKRMKTIHTPVFTTGFPLVNEHKTTVPTYVEFNRDIAQRLTNPTNDIIQLNHYKVKSKSEWMERATQRGAVAGNKWRDHEADFYEFDYTKGEDRTILRFLPELKERLREKNVRRRIITDEFKG